MGAVGCSFPTQMSVRPCHLLGVEPGQLQRWGLRQGGWTSVSPPGCGQGQRRARGGVSWDWGPSVMAPNAVQLLG